MATGRLSRWWTPAVLGLRALVARPAELRDVDMRLLVARLHAHEHLRELAPHAEYTDIIDATHMVAGDANDAFSAAILGFLGRQSSF